MSSHIFYDGEAAQKAVEFWESYGYACSVIKDHGGPGVFVVLVIDEAGAKPYRVEVKRL